jgi:hypothetical protein
LFNCVDQEGELKKFSGSAFEVELGGKFINKRNLHHGTLLLNTDLSAMQNLLSPHVLKMKSKGIDSIRARVCNLNSIEPSLTHLDLVKAISEAFYNRHDSEFSRSDLMGDFNELEFSQNKDDYHNLLQRDLLFYKQKENNEPKFMIQNDRMDLEGVSSCDPNIMDLNIRNTNIDVFDNHLISNIWKRMTSQDWILGEAPSFSNNIEFKNEAGFFDIYYESEKGQFKSFMIFSDCLFSGFVESIEQYFTINTSVVCGREGIEEARQVLHRKYHNDPMIAPIVDIFFDDLVSSFE